MQQSLAARLSLATFALFLVAFSPALLLLNGFSYPDFYGENVGFRFFWTMRWVDGAATDFIHPGQGTLLPFIQAIYYLLSSGDLWSRITEFADLTAIGGIVSMGATLLVIALDRTITELARIVLLLTPVVLALSHAHTFAYHLYPDYHAYEKALMLAVAWFYVRAFICEKPRLTDFAIIGLLAGLAASLKLSLGPVVILLAFAQGPISGVFVAVATSAVVYSALLVLYYGGNIKWAADYFYIMRGFSGGDWPFDWLAMSPFASWREHSMSNLTVYATAALVFAALLMRRRAGLSVVIVAAVAGAVEMAIKRGGGGSYFDAFVIAVCFCAIAISALHWPRLERAAIAGMVLNVAIWCAADWRALATDNGLISAKAGGSWQRQLYNWNESKGLPIISIFPSNTYVVGSIEDMMMRGFSNFARPWYESNENASRKKLFPRHTFGSYDVKTSRPAVVEWVEAIQPYPWPGDFTENNRRLSKVVSGTSRGDCVSFDPPLTPYLRVHSCVFK